MTGERVDLELQQMDATIFDEFIDTMECNLYCRCGAPNDAVDKMAKEIVSLRAQVAALAAERDQCQEMYAQWITWARTAEARCQPAQLAEDSYGMQTTIDDALATHIDGFARKHESTQPHQSPLDVGARSEDQV